MMPLTKEQILNRKPILREVQIPQWGGFDYIRPLTVAEQTKLAELGTKSGKANTAARSKNLTLQVIKWSLTDADGVSVFEDGDLDQLLQSDASAIVSLQDAIIRYSGLTEESRGELEKNLLRRDRNALTGQSRRRLLIGPDMRKGFYGFFLQKGWIWSKGRRKRAATGKTQSQSGPTEGGHRIPSHPWFPNPGKVDARAQSAGEAAFMGVIGAELGELS